MIWRSKSWHCLMSAISSMYRLFRIISWILPKIKGLFVSIVCQSDKQRWYSLWQQHFVRWYSSTEFSNRQGVDWHNEFVQKASLEGRWKSGGYDKLVQSHGATVLQRVRQLILLFWSTLIRINQDVQRGDRVLRCKRRFRRRDKVVEA